MKRSLVASILIVFGSILMWSQELRCTVDINTDAAENAPKETFQQLKEEISSYINDRIWTNAQFAPNERIECRMFFTIKSYDGQKAKGELQVQASRPVYNSDYITVLLNFKDQKVEFDYRDGDPLTFSDSSWEGNLTGILNFYAYLILGMDFDSFSPSGGEEYYAKAAQIVQMAQSSGEIGWRAFEDTRNRSAVLSALTDSGTSGLRKLLYSYHRNGLDQMSSAPEKGREAITESLGELTEVAERAPMSVGLSLFSDAKLDELVGIYSQADSAERDKVWKILSKIYPASNQLEKIKRN